jgi:two-component system, NarL family, sensor histidine kinase UhpB
MWKKLPLRVRLFLPTIALIAASLVFGVLALQIFSPEQLQYENEQGIESALSTSRALNAALSVAANPQQTLDAYAGNLSTKDAIQFRRADPNAAIPSVRISTNKVPGWFIRLLEIPNITSSHPIMIGDQHAGDIVFSPDLSADLFEKWVGFLAIALSGSCLLILAAFSAYLTITLALRPLEALGTGLTRMQQGDYESQVPLLGPPEIRQSCEEANQLGHKLKQLVQYNRDLLHRIVSLQDDERHELANELHDELGPLLFAIKANAIALLDNTPDSPNDPGSPYHHLLEAAEAIQHVSHRIIEGLSPLHLKEIGLDKSVQTILQNARAAQPALHAVSSVDPRLTSLDDLTSQTIYRVVQESVTNVVRHARATALNVLVERRDRAIAVEIYDDGIGFLNGVHFGRGLTGMSERIRAVGGTLELLRQDNRTVLRAFLPPILS